MMRAIILALFILIGGAVIAQEDPVIKLDATILNAENNKKLSGVTIEILQDGKPFASETSASNGRVPIVDLPIGYIYIIKVKKSGFVTKVAKVDARFDYPEDLGEYTPLQFKSSLFETVEDIDFTFLENTPMIEFEMDAQGLLEYDRAKLKDMNKRIEELRRKMEEKKEELEKEEVEKAKREADFNAYVDAGDAAMKKKDYEKAIGQYELALGIKSDDQPTQAKLQTAKEKLEELNNAEQAEKDYESKMAEAKSAESKTELEKAVALYKEASGIKPDEQDPKTKIAELEKKIAEQKKNEEAFNKLVADGDGAMGSENFEDAVTKYEEALKLKQDPAVQTKLANAKKKKEEQADALAEAEANKKKYDQLMAMAEGEFNGEKYQEAKGHYEEASSLLPDEAEPKAKLIEIEKKLKELADQQAAQEKLEADYKKLMEEGKEKINQRVWEDAKSKYEEALKLKPMDSEALKQIDEINSEIQKEADAAANAEKAEAEYKEFMSQGNAAKDQKDYVTALDRYKKALAIKEGDTDAQAKIDEVNKAIEEQNRLADEQAKFDGFVAAAENDFNTKDYEKAKANYESALGIKDDAGVKAKIAEIDKLILENQNAAEEQAKYEAAIKEADKLFDANDNQAALDKYKEALLIKEEDHPKNRISELETRIANDAAAKKLDEDYAALMSEARNLFDQEKYEEAKGKYQEAIALKDEAEPKAQIAEIDRLLAAAKGEAELEAEYQKLMEDGKESFDQKEYNSALESYKNAIGLKPGDSAAQGQIDAINKLVDEQNKLAEEQAKFDGFVAEAEQSFNALDYDKAKLNYNNALDIKEDPELRKRITEIDELIAASQSAAETQAKYDAAITEADQLYSDNNYKDALAKYKEALSIKDESHPKERISDLTQKIDAQESELAKEEEFNNLVSEATTAFDAQDYQKALEKYKEAIKVKPDPTISQKIGEIDGLLAEQLQNEGTQKLYDAKIAEAKAAFEDENWNGAIGLYEDASDILPDETLPAEQIAIIQTKMAEESEKEAERLYQKIITKADALFDEDKLDEAQGYYERALRTKSSDAHAKERIEEIAAIKLERSNSEADAKRIEEEYSALMKEGDAASDASNWTLALEKYKEALKKKPGEPIPQSKIKEIEDKMGAAELEKQKEEDYAKQFAIAEDLFNAQDYENAIPAYKEALEIKDDEPLPKERITSAENFLRLASRNSEEEAYQELLADAQEKFEANDFEKALDLYLEAKTLRPDDTLPPRRIAEINQAILDQNAIDDEEENYKAYLKDADYQYEKGEFKKALEAYTNAFNVFNREYPEEQIKKCKEALDKSTTVEVDKNYQKIIDKANEYFDKKNYTKAKGLYERALGFKPNDQYPKDQLRAIDAILNPQPLAKTTLPDYGAPNRSVNAMDLENMLKDAQEQRKYMSAQKAEQQRLDAADAGQEDLKSQTDENYKTRERVIDLGEELEEDRTLAEEETVESAAMVEGMQVDLSDIDRERSDDNENEVQRQNQMVNNVVLEIEEADDGLDDEREEYENRVEEIREELIVENELEDADQTNATYNQVDYIEDYVENRVENDPNNDVDRLNTEIRIEDHNIELINEKNENTWDQEDVILEVKENTEEIMDIQSADHIEQDLPREEGITIIEDEVLAIADFESDVRDDQYDVTIDQKKYTENLVTQIEIENIGNDLPRERMEGFTEGQVIELAETSEELVLDQNNVLFESDGLLEDMEVEITDVGTEKSDDREGYEQVVEVMREEGDEFIQDKTNESVDESYSTVDYIEDGTVDREDDNKDANDNANDLIDNTSDAVDELVDAEAELDEESRVDLENAEDYVESIKDIDVKKIDEDVKNALGEQFPEGVTEEIYTVNDEDGLIVSSVVRRVVVRNEVGNVYEKVQTRYGTVSYTCNGVGITEFDWQDQTEASDLVRN